MPQPLGAPSLATAFKWSPSSAVLLPHPSRAPTNDILFLFPQCPHLQPTRGPRAQNKVDPGNVGVNEPVGQGRSWEACSVRWEMSCTGRRAGSTVGWGKEGSYPRLAGEGWVAGQGQHLTVGRLLCKLQATAGKCWAGLLLPAGGKLGRVHGERPCPAWQCVQGHQLPVPQSLPSRCRDPNKEKQGQG